MDTPRQGALWRRLEYRFLSLAVAVWAKNMRGFAICGRFFQNVSVHTNGVEFFELIALLLSIPFFKISNFFFEGAYALNQRRELLIGGHYAVLGVDDFKIEFRNLSPNERNIAGRQKALGDCLYAVNRLERRRNCSHVSH